MREAKWQQFREATSIVLGACALFFGIFKNDPAMMTIGAGLVGFSPAAKGPAGESE